MSDPDALRLPAEIRDLQIVIAKRQKLIVGTNLTLCILGMVFCAAFLAEIAVVICVLLRT